MRSTACRWRGLHKILFYQVRAHYGTPVLGPEGKTGRFEDFHAGYFGENLRTLIERTRAAKAQLVLVTLPRPLRRNLQSIDLISRQIHFLCLSFGNEVGDFVDLIEIYGGTMHQVGSDTGVPVADVARRFDQITEPAPYFMGTIHPNAGGNDLIAEFVERGLRAEILQSKPMYSDPLGHTG